MDWWPFCLGFHPSKTFPSLGGVASLGLQWKPWKLGNGSSALPKGPSHHNTADSVPVVGFVQCVHCTECTMCTLYSVVYIIHCTISTLQSQTGFLGWTKPRHIHLNLSWLRQNFVFIFRYFLNSDLDPSKRFYSSLDPFRSFRTYKINLSNL